MFPFFDHHPWHLFAEKVYDAVIMVGKVVRSVPGAAVRNHDTCMENSQNVEGMISIRLPLMMIDLRIGQNERADTSLGNE